MPMRLASVCGLITLPVSAAPAAGAAGIAAAAARAAAAAAAAADVAAGLAGCAGWEGLPVSDMDGLLLLADGERLDDHGGRHGQASVLEDRADLGGALGDAQLDQLRELAVAV